MKSSSLSHLAKGALTAATLAFTYFASPAQAQQINTVWVIDFENRNWTENETSGGAQLFGSSAAPYINSLVTPGNPNAAQVSYCSAYHNVLATPSGSNPSIHPSEPNYLWQEGGSNFSIANDNDPYSSQVSTINSYANNNGLSLQTLSTLLQNAGLSWTSYQEGTNLKNTSGNNFNTAGGTLSNNIVPVGSRTVPLSSFSGSSNSYINPYNGTHQYNFACKHDGTLFFTTTNGSSLTSANTSTSNPEVGHYAPLEQLDTDLQNGTCAKYNLITPDQYNDMHTALSGGFTYNGTHYTGDLAQIAQGDNFLSKIIPKITASAQFQNNGCVIIWTDETEGSNQNDFNHTLMEIIISPLAKGNAYNSTLNYTHSSDLATTQEIFRIKANTATGYLNDAANLSNASTGGGGQARDLSDLFQASVIQTNLNPPAAPASLAAAQAAGTVNLTWAAVSGATGYNVKRATTSGGPYATLGTSTTAAYSDSTAAAGTTYFYVVTSTSGTGESSASSEVSINPLAAPASLAAAQVDGAVSLNWSAVSGATGYNVKRSTTSGGPFAMIATSPTASYSDSTAAAGTAYYYVVTATNASGESLASTQASIDPLAAPADVTASQDGLSASLTWTPVPGATGYNVKRSTSSGGPFTTIDTTTSASYSDSTAVPGVTYYYVITATNAAGESLGSILVALALEGPATADTPAMPVPLLAVMGVLLALFAVRMLPARPLN